MRMRFHLSLVLFVTFLSTLFGLVPWHITGARLRSSPSSCSASIDEEDEEDSRYAPEYHRKMRENYPKTSEVWPRNWPDFSKLKPSDPLFLDMPWPTERGPEASAYARHLQWKRLLSDGDSEFQKKMCTQKKGGNGFVSIFLQESGGKSGLCTPGFRKMTSTNMALKITSFITCWMI